MGENSNIPNGEHFENFTLTAIYLKEKIKSNDIILVQGSQKISLDTFEGKFEVHIKPQHPKHHCIWNHDVQVITMNV